MPFASSTTETPKEKIIKRFLELYETSDELKDLFNSFLSNDSIFKTLLNIESITEKRKIAEILVEYLGVHFLNTAGKNYNVSGLSNKNGEDGKFLIRQKLLEQICKRNSAPEEKKKEIILEYNIYAHTEYTEFSQIARDSKFFRWAPLIKILDLPGITLESPPKQNPEDETTTVSKKPPLKPLYDYQTQAVAFISDMLSEKERGKRKIINIPTGAGKTRLAVEALVDWINNRDQNKIPDAADQQKNGRIVFWFASTNELCSQAASEFVNIYSQIGMGITPFNVTRLYGSDRRSLDDILIDYPGIHIVVTNTEHFEKRLKDEAVSGKRFRIERYENSEYFKKISSETIAIVIDEAHEVTMDSYQNFVAAMGFDFSGRLVSKGNVNRNNIVLIGLTATPYKGSGYLKKQWRCKVCNKIFKQDSDRDKKYHKEQYPYHIIDQIPVDHDDELDDFANFDEGNDPSYLKQLDKGTRLIHKIFDGVLIPIPQKQFRESYPEPIIEAPEYAYVGEYVKVSGLKSFDKYSDLDFEWTINEFGNDLKFPVKNQQVFYHKFSNPGTHHINLTVTNQSKKSKSKIHAIEVYPSTISKEIRKGNLSDNKEFNLILQERKILSKIVYGVINGPQLQWTEKEIKNWRTGNLSEENEAIIEKAIEYNKQICDIVYKCVKKYERKKVLIFAGSVNHAQNLALLLEVKYGLRAKSIDSNMNPGIRRQIIRDFREDDKMDVLCNYAILTTGFDVPKIDTLLICRDVGSNALYTQMIGRGQRGLIAGGKEELWLITSHFKKPGFDEGGVLRLGWEALVETWQNFRLDVKDDLNVKDNIEYALGTEKIEPEIKITSVETNPQIISLKPLRIKCMTCKKEREGIENIVEFFKLEGPRNILQDAIQKGTFPKNCYQCRKLISIEKDSKCNFCKTFIQNNDHDPIFVEIANFAFHTQLSKKLKYNFKDLQDSLYNRFDEKIPYSFFSLSNSSIRKFMRLELLLIRNNLEIDFAKIDDFTTLRELIDYEIQTQELKNNEKEIIEIYKNSDPDKFSEDFDKLKTLFDELKITFGHIPTTRQFIASVKEKNMWTEFINGYGASYKKFLNFHREFIKDDQNLMDALYGEYFDKCIQVRRKVSHDELDTSGQYKIGDYDDVFDSFERFEEMTKKDLKLVLENFDEKQKEKNKEFEEINNDLKTIWKNLGRFPHYEDIKMYSEIGIYRYLIQIKISHLQYLRNYTGEDIGTFLRLVNTFLKLKNILMMTPTREQFCNSKLVSLEIISEYGKIFNFNYKEFLKTMDLVDVEKIPIGHVEEMKKRTIEKLKKYKEKNGTEKLSALIDSKIYSDDELSISVNAWFEDKNSLKKQLE